MSGLYIHIPFCLSKCSYCDFISYPLTCHSFEGYEQLLDKEMELRAQTKEFKFNTVYIGGGTPSVLPSIDFILKSANKHFSIVNDAEITIEANPATVDEAKLKSYLDAGINRISFGVQSFDDNELKTISRRHNSRDAVESIAMARKVGFRNINLDLIYGLPNQTCEAFERTLNTAAQLRPDHISCYSLILEEGTRLYREVEEGKITLPNEDEVEKMYALATRCLEQLGMKRYEVSNYAHEGFQCRHNINYWNNGQYLGVGCAAHSHVDNSRIENYRSLEEYREALNNNTLPVCEITVNGEEDEMFETVMMGLRKIEGIDLGEFEKRFGRSLISVFPDAVKSNIEKKLLEITDNKIRLTQRGMDIMNSVLINFINNG